MGVKEVRLRRRRQSLVFLALVAVLWSVVTRKEELRAAALRWHGAGGGGAAPLLGRVIPTHNGRFYTIFDAGNRPDDTNYHVVNTSCPVAWEWTTDPTTADVVLDNVLDVPAFSGRPALAHANQVAAFMSLESLTWHPNTFDAVSQGGYNVSMDFRIWGDHPRGAAEVPAVYLLNPTAPDFPIDFRAPPALPKRTDALVAAFISNCAPRNRRNEVLAGLMAELPVHSFGRCMRNANETEQPGYDPGEHYLQAKKRLAASYAFVFAAENCDEPGYVTEKVYAGYASGAVPVYLGAPDVARFVPEGSYIDAAAFETPAALAAHLREVAADEAKYLQYFEWQSREFSPELKRVLRLAARTPHCRLVMGLAGRDGEADLAGLDLFPPR